MSGNETFLVPELHALITGQTPKTFVYADYNKCEKFEGAKRGGSPNLAKLGNACRFLDKSKNYKKLGFQDPEQEFIDWMEYEEDNGWMWNEQGPSPIYDWMHLLPQLVYCVYGGALSASLSNEWVIQYLKALDFGALKTRYGFKVAQVGMRGSKAEPRDMVGEWLLLYARTGKKDNESFKPWMESNELVQFVLNKTGTLLQRLYASEPEHWWPVRVEQRWIRFADGVVAYLTEAGNGNTQERAFDGVWMDGTRLSLPVNGYRKQGFKDDMECVVNTNDMVVIYKSELFTDNRHITYQLPGSPTILHEITWNKYGLKTKYPGDNFMPEEPKTPPPSVPTDDKKPKRSFRHRLRRALCNLR